MKTLFRTVLTFLLATSVAAPTMAARKDPALKAALKCRTVISKKGFASINATLKKLDGCHKKRDKGKFNGECNSADLSALKAKLGAVARACSKAPGVLANYAGGDAPTAIAAGAKDALDASGQAVLGSPSLTGDKAKGKCHGAIAKGRSKIVAAIVKSATACQRSQDKNAQTFGAIAESCLGAPGGAGSQASSLISKGCGTTAGADVGSCDSLPGCVVDSATDTGKAVARGIYSSTTGGGEPECHNEVVEDGEVCDLGLDTEECVNCQGPNTCGDDFRSVSEECDDGNTTAGDGCTADCHAEAPPGGSLVDVVVTIDYDPTVILDFAGVQVTLAYPPVKLEIPGSGNVSAAEGRVAKEGSDNVTLEVSDTDGNSDGQDDTLRLYYFGADATAVPDGNIARIRFDGLPGAMVTAADLTCSVVQTFESNGNDHVAGPVACSVTVMQVTVTTTTTTATTSTSTATTSTATSSTTTTT